MDQWPGYEVSRRRLLRFFHERKIPNPVVLTGDIHLNWVNNLQLDFKDPEVPLVGTEWVGTSMFLRQQGNFIPEYERDAKQNDFVQWYNSNRGYVSCELTPKVENLFQGHPFVTKKGSPRNQGRLRRSRKEDRAPKRSSREPGAISNPVAFSLSIRILCPGWFARSDPHGHPW